MRGADAPFLLASLVPSAADLFEIKEVLAADLLACTSE